MLPFSFVSASPFASTALGSSATTASFSGVDIFKRDSIVQKHQNCFCCNELLATIVDYVITVYDMKIPQGRNSIYHQIKAQIQFSSLCLFYFHRNTSTITFNCINLRFSWYFKGTEMKSWHQVLYKKTFLFMLPFTRLTIILILATYKNNVGKRKEIVITFCCQDRSILY